MWFLRYRPTSGQIAIFRTPPGGKVKPNILNIFYSPDARGRCRMVAARLVHQFSLDLRGASYIVFLKTLSVY